MSQFGLQLGRRLTEFRMRKNSNSSGSVSDSCFNRFFINSNQTASLFFQNVFGLLDRFNYPKCRGQALHYDLWIIKIHFRISISWHHDRRDAFFQYWAAVRVVSPRRQLLIWNDLIWNWDWSFIYNLTLTLHWLNDVILFLNYDIHPWWIRSFPALCVCSPFRNSLAARNLFNSF